MTMKPLLFKTFILFSVTLMFEGCFVGIAFDKKLEIKGNNAFVVLNEYKVNNINENISDDLRPSVSIEIYKRKNEFILPLLLINFVFTWDTTKDFEFIDIQIDEHNKSNNIRIVSSFLICEQSRFKINSQQPLLLLNKYNNNDSFECKNKLFVSKDYFLCTTSSVNYYNYYAGKDFAIEKTDFCNCTHLKNINLELEYEAYSGNSVYRKKVTIPLKYKKNDFQFDHIGSFSSLK